MKKVIIFLFFIVIVLLFSNKGEEKLVIPKNSIRYRIIANSNSLEDQEQKLEIKKELDPIINEILLNSKNIEEAREKIDNKIPIIRNTLDTYKVNYKINYGNNYFPEKEYNNVTYPEGEYESLVITLGDGIGDNWWCVLFPPLCLLEAEESDVDEVNYSFYAKKIIDKFY